MPNSRDRLGDERVVDGGDDRDHRAGRGQRFDRQRVADVVAARAAPLVGNRHAEQARAPASLAHQVARERRLLVDRRGLRRDALARERGDLAAGTPSGRR